MNISQFNTPNFSPYRLGYKPEAILLHWINGPLAVADAAFSRSATQVSAHAGIENSEIHEYVNTDFTAWHAGNWEVNLRTIGIEHSAQPGREATPQTVETSIEYVTTKCHTYGINPHGTFTFTSRDGTKKTVPCIFGHDEVIPTQCPGTIPVEHIRDEVAVRLSLIGIDQEVPKPTSVPVIEASVQCFWVRVVTPILRVRTAPSTSAQVRGDKELQEGDMVECIQAVMGDDPYGTGNNVWLLTKISRLYIWSGGTDYHK